MSILQMSFTVPMAPNPQQLSFLGSLSSSPDNSILFLRSKLSHLSLQSQPLRRKTLIIRMGGGPRTYPGGVSKWQWKRMQAKKAKQLLKARLARERQIYEMRKRAELKAAASELERPWEVVERAPNLFSVRADEQLKVLADRFQRPGGFDMWTDQDGPQLLRADDEVPSARFFPKGVVHSVKPYARIDAPEALGGEIGGQRALPGNRHNSKGIGNGKGSGRQLKEKGQGAELERESSRNVVESKGENGQTEKTYNGKLRRKRRNMDKFGEPGASNGYSGSNSGQAGYDRKQRGKSFLKGNGQQRRGDLDSEVYDMSLQGDGSYGLQAKGDKKSDAKEEIAKLRFFSSPSH